MRKLMVLAAMLAMMMVAAAPAMAQTTDGGDENSVDLSLGDGSSFEDGFYWVYFYDGVYYIGDAMTTA